MDNAWVQALFSKLCSRDKTAPQIITDKIPPLKVDVYFILKVHNLLFTDPT